MPDYQRFLRIQPSALDTAPQAAQMSSAAPCAAHLLPLFTVQQPAEAGQGKEKVVQRIWLYRYHMYWCQYRIGKKDDVREGLKALKIIGKATNEPLGGKDIMLQRKFTELETAVGD